MCGRFGLWAEPRQIEDHFQVQLHLPITPRYNIPPGEEILAIGQSEDGLRKAAWLYWGLVPRWSKEPNSGYKMINARSECMFDKPAYKSAARKRRCLIYASCFFEWKRRGQGSKQPYCIRPRDAALFAFAGIWERWEDKEAGHSINSCAIVTTRANEAVQKLHDRMPVIIARDNFGLWLDRSVQKPEALQSLLEPLASQELEIYQVGLAVNNPRNDSEEVIHPSK